MNKRWTIKEPLAEVVATLCKELRIHHVFCKLLALRGITSYSEAKKFFRSEEAHLYDPFLMKGMNEAVTLINQCILNQERILIYGDYDVDGTTAVALVYSYFSDFSDNIDYYIPHRFNEGYGLSQKGIDYAKENNISLIITLDCGIKSIELVQMAREADIDIIVCDHHMPGDILPSANAILNPKQKDCEYPFKELCGCGVGYKLISAYAMKYQKNEHKVNDHIDLLATAIAADIVPITDENRTLSILGLHKANDNPSIPLRALKQISKHEKQFTISDLVFIIAPRVNAAGRIDDAEKAVELFICEDELKARNLAAQLQDDNNERKDIDKNTTAEALDALHEIALKHEYSTVVYQSHWHKGVVGIVASRLIEHRYRPTVVLTESNGKISGSARSIKGFNLFDGLNECAHLLEAYGGHYFAAGLTMAKENLDVFRETFDTVVQRMLPEHLLEPEIEIDAELELKDINDSFLNILKQFAPHGPDNMRPVFISRNVIDHKQMSSVVKEKHLRLFVTQNGSQAISAIGFSMADKLQVVKSKASFDILYHIDENEWQGQKTIQLKLLDVR